MDRFLDVNFNSLDTTVNQQTWVALLDFFGIGTPKPPSSQSTSGPSSAASPDTSLPTSPAAQNASSVTPDDVEQQLKQQDSASQAAGSAVHVSQAQREPTSDIKVRVHSLSLTLNKPQYPLAKASVGGLDVGVLLKDGNISVNGSLKTMSLIDLTPSGSLYRERSVVPLVSLLSLHF